MLHILPSEVLSQVALHLVLESGAPPVNLLRTCVSVHSAVSPQANPNLYAEVFRQQYDTAAARRRLGQAPSSRDLVSELRTRTRALTRLSRSGADPLASDLWVVYLMLLENDGKNLQRLLLPKPVGPSVDMVPLIEAFHLRTLASADSSEYPPERIVDALAMWISWFLDDYSYASSKSLQSLRPYVFAAHKYDLFFAPWTLAHLPDPCPTKDNPYSPGPFTVDRNPQARGQALPYYGRAIQLSHPVLSHAAMLRFFSGAQKAENERSPSPASPLDYGAEVEDPDFRAPPRAALQSLSHDADFERLKACTDGKRSPGRPISAWRGVFSGCWEGNFTFLDFDAFRDMLQGHVKAIFQGPYGEQAQVWKLRETFVRPTPGYAAGSSTRPGLPLTGPMTNAGFKTNLRPFAADPLLDRPKGTSPEDAMIEDALARQLEALDGYEAVPEAEVDGELAAAEASDTGLGLLVTGLGHSAWGRFVISGHVRIWDGLLYLVKEYAPYQRGKWVYRGYVVSDDMMVGRWRDTFTSEDYVGYEGTFILNRR